MGLVIYKKRLPLLLYEPLLARDFRFSEINCDDSLAYEWGREKELASVRGVFDHYLGITWTLRDPWLSDGHTSRTYTGPAEMHLFRTRYSLTHVEQEMSIRVEAVGRSAYVELTFTPPVLEDPYSRCWYGIGSIVEARALFLDWHQVAVIHHGPPLRVLVPRRFDTVRVNSLPCSPTHGRASEESATGRRSLGAG